jgi:hypothetical protein
MDTETAIANGATIKYATVSPKDLNKFMSTIAQGIRSNITDKTESAKKINDVQALFYKSGTIKGNTIYIDRSLQEQEDAINKSITDATGSVTDKIKETTGLTDNSPLKTGSDTNALIGGVLNGLGGSNSSAAPEKKLPSSRDKNTSYGNFDFWVVKLKDESKSERVKLNLEVSPNPTFGYTNIVIGYDFDSGTATVVDLAGRQLQQFTITSATVPIDLSSVPEGIYIVNIKTYYQGKMSSEGVKIIKGISKN